MKLRKELFLLGIILGLAVLILRTESVFAFFRIDPIAPQRPNLPIRQMNPVNKMQRIKFKKINPTATPTPSATPTPTLTPTPTPIFAEEFDSFSLDTWEWYPNGGVTQIGDGIIALSGNPPSNFPFFRIKFNPFPTVGDFSLETRINYTQIGSAGTGLVFSQNPQDPFSFGSAYLSPSFGGVWSDGVVFNLQNVVPLPGLGFFTYRFSFQEPNFWKIYVDDIKVAEREDNRRPGSLWFGSPDPDIHTNWSNFGIDFIRIYGYDK